MVVVKIMVKHRTDAAHIQQNFCRRGSAEFFAGAVAPNPQMVGLLLIQSIVLLLLLR